ncbi:MAG: HD domain-containing protein, partial [Pseudomonadota bacterium]
MAQSSETAFSDIVADSRQWVHERAAAALRPDIAAAADAVHDIVAGLAEDPLLNAAAMLRPAVRAGLISGEQIARRFGSEIADFSSQLGRLDAIAIDRDWSDDAAVTPDQAEALRRMLLALVNDVRLILVRLAEVVQTLRAAKNDDDESRRRLAREVQGLYAPLANRLGVWQLKWELEDLSFRYLEPDTYQQIARYLKSRRDEREAYLTRVKRELGTELDRAGVRHEITGRPCAASCARCCRCASRA